MTHNSHAIGVAIIQNVTPNHHHAVYIDGFARKLQDSEFRPTVILQDTTDPIQFANIPYDLHLIKGKYKSFMGQAQFGMNLWSALSGVKNCQIVHTMNPFMPLAISMIWRKFQPYQDRPKIIYDVRGLWVEIGTYAGHLPGWAGKLLDAIDISLTKRADMVIAISEELKQVMITKGTPESHIRVVPGGVDLEKFRRATPFSFKEEWGWNGLVIGYVSSIGKARHSDLIIKAFKKVTEQVDLPIYLVMIGPIAQPEYFGGLVADLGVEHRVKLTGFMPHDQVPSMVKGFDIAVSIYSPQIYDHDRVRVPYKVLEYLGAGVPVLACNNPSHTNILRHQHDAYIVKPSEEGIAQGMVELIRNPEMRINLGEAGLVTSQKYSFDYVATLLQNLYSGLLE